MKKIIFLISFLVLIGIAEAVNITLTVSWSLSSSTIRPSGDLVIYLTATNPGVDLTSVTLTATPGPYLRLTSGNKIELGDMVYTASQQSSISVKADANAEASVSYVYLEAKYYYSNTEYKRTFYIPITIRKDPILEVSNVKFSDTAAPGKTLSLTFDIYNKGDDTARDLNVKLNSTTLFANTGSTGETIISELKSSEFKTLSFLITINPDADIGIESIPLSLFYYDNTKTNNYTQIKNIGLKISGNAEFVVTVDSYQNFYYGHLGEVSIALANRGLAPADFISVNARSDFGSKEFYIGSLDSDDSETIDLTQDLTRVSGKYPIYLTINYKDRFGNEYSVEKIVEAIPTNAPIDYTSVLIVVVVLAIIGYWLYRKRKK